MRGTSIVSGRLSYRSYSSGRMSIPGQSSRTGLSGGVTQRAPLTSTHRRPSSSMPVEVPYCGYESGTVNRTPLRTLTPTLHRPSASMGRMSR